LKFLRIRIPLRWRGGENFKEIFDGVAFMLIAIQEDLKVIFYGRIFREQNLFLVKDFKP